MSLSIQIELQDVDVERFRAMFQQAKSVAQSMSDADLLHATRRMIEDAEEKNPKGFIRDRILGLKELADMIDDETWRLPAEDRALALQALAYFVNPDDLIPDKTPGVGFLDDAIAAELVLRALAPELETYSQFSAFRETEAQRRANGGLTTDISKEDWLADQRAQLHSRIRELRTQQWPGWRSTLFG